MSTTAVSRHGVQTLVASRSRFCCRGIRAVPRPTLCRLFSVSSARLAKESSKTSKVTAEDKAKLWDEYKQSFHFAPESPADNLRVGATVTVHGFLGKRRDISTKAAFVDVVHPGRPRPVQVRSAWEVEGSPEHELHLQLKATNAHSPVSVTGQVEEVSSGGQAEARNALVRLAGIQVLNAFPRDIIVSKGVQFPATARHLQMRFSEALQRRLAFRSDVAGWSRRQLTSAGFREFETPVLFKSTPEGAREFIVPTRRRGFAYALPQSPQQFKQILMASGVAGGYFQFARCFRDEDLRADRQPEFTQLDLEMAFATGEDVMQAVERYTKELFAYLGETYRLVKNGTGDGNETIPVPVKALSRGRGTPSTRPYAVLPDEPFLRMAYDEAMAKYGSDKPDLRIPGEIHRLDHILPSNFTSMITSLEDPIVDAWRLRLDGSPSESRKFVQRLFDALPTAISKNPDGMPAVMVYDSSKPLCGLAPLGHEAFDALTDTDLHPELASLSDLEDGDVLLLQARKRAPFFSGGSTALGLLRLEAYRAAVEEELLPFDDTFRFLWVVGFPMFTATDADTTDPGQGGHAGFSATHHPFTAPLTERDFELLTTDPLRAKADHYDLVVNGVELGGGSRRIHVAAVQEAVMRDILKMDDAGVAQFGHLLDALRAGCPPHAGFALGFDRLVAVLSGTGSVRDVIVFPKSMKGEDQSVKSPGRMTPQQLETYHLALRSAKASQGDETKT
ncbi:aspartyl-tRNA synthetase [Sporothrix brasiliensis 5110]|uniref:Aspartyl-tRNA synthetase n=1 Tax=Sporothrix brasiliensis 5110 TaxID=1398154 RepID=A0A0C2ISQ5_9PEZI|nr:aspartyl-tRNA synthetase [Sporothrix brasiliensis 5110]KIH88017.1 aspartyl-tRNA synthetase [Sporothrix brasiliensis 5110]